VSFSQRVVDLPTKEKVVGVLVLLCLILGTLTRPLVTHFDPELAVKAAVNRAEHRIQADPQAADEPHVDPWGQPLGWGGPYVTSWGRDRSPEVVSMEDEEVEPGDDVTVELEDLHGPADTFVAWSREAFFLLALLLAWSIRAPGLHSPRSPGLVPELLRAAVLASPPAGIGLVLVRWATREPWATPLRSDWALPVLSKPFALGASLVVLCYLVALGVRLRRAPRSHTDGDVDHLEAGTGDSGSGS